MSRLVSLLSVTSGLLPLLLVSGCGQSSGPRTASVTATAYTMAQRETKKGNIGLTAWGDHLKPGMKTIAVSRDLIAKGLTHNTKVHIEGLDGTYTVLDKMNKRWTDKIDIFMGKNREKASDWGKKEVTVTWQTKDND